MKSMREVDLDTYSLSLLTAKEDILNPRSSTNWALFAYDGIMNRLKLADSGVGGLKELTAKLHPRRPLYGMCRVGKAQPRIAMILWVGKEVDEYRKAECASHLPAIRAFFKEVHIFLPAHTLDEITEERICTLAYSATVVTQGPRGRPGRRTEDRQAIVGTNYKRTFAAAEIQRIQRDSFWAQAEREEEERKKEEQRRAAEDRRQREKERFLQERRDAIERERRMNEKEQEIKEQRRIQAQMEAEARKVEKIKWKHEEREREEEEIRARYSRSQSEEKAAEAAALVSQRTLNPREFFRQLSSSGVHTPSSPTCPVRSPYRQLRRSQTDNIFSFNESPSSTPTSPYRSSVVSPYFPSSPTSRSPILFTCTTASSLQNGATVSTKSQIQLPSPKMMEPLFQTQPSPSTNTTESEIKTPISDILDSLVFYPPPPIPEQLQPDVSEIEDEFPPPPPGFENSPEPSVNQSETPDDVLDPLLPVASSCVLVPEPPTRPLPALPVSPQMLTDLELERDFTAQASVISTVEEEEDEVSEEKVNKEMDGEKRGGEKRAETGETQNRGQEEHDGMTMEKCKIEKESNGKMTEEHKSEEKQYIMEEREHEEEKVGDIVEEFESGKIMEEQESEKTQHETLSLENVLEKEEDKEMIEKHEKDLEEDENEKIVEEHEQEGKIVDAFDNEKEQDKKSMEVSGTELIQYAKMKEECGQEKEQNRKMEERCEEEHESEKDNGGKMMEELEVQKIQDGNIMEEHESVKITKKHVQDGKTVNAFDNEKEQDEKSMGVSETETMQCAKMMEVCGQENEQNRKMEEKCEEEHESEKKNGGKIMKLEVEKIQDGGIMEEPKSVKEQDWKIIEKFESEKIQNAKMMLQYMRENERDEKIVDAFDNEKEQDKKSMNYLKNMEECGQENWKIAEKCEEEHECEKEQAGEIMKEHEVEKIQVGNIMEEHENERQENEQNGKTVEKCEEEYKSEKEIDGEMTEEHESKEKQDEKCVDPCDNEKEEEKICMETSETENILYAKVMEECGQENEHNWKIVEEHEIEKEQAGEIMQEHEVEKIQDGNLMKENESKRQENEQDGKMTEEHGNKEKQDEKIVDSLDSDEKQDEINMEVFETEKLQNASKMEECGQENEQDGKIVKEHLKEHDSEKILDGDREEHKSEKEEGWKVVEVFETEKIQYVKIMEECEQETEQDGKTVEIHEHGKSLAEHESKNEQDCKMTEDCGSEKIHDGDFIEEHEGAKQDWKVVEVFETEKIQYVKIMVTCEPENEQDGKNVEKCVEEHESGENQDGRRLEEQDKIMDVFESEKELDCKIGERHEDGKSLEQEGEKDQSWKMTETCESETIQYRNIKKDSKNQDNEGMSHMDVDKAVNVTVLRKKESYTEIIKRDKAIAESDEELKSDKENEKEQMDISLIQTETADTAFSQHAPLLPESHATEPSQISDAFVPESISITQDKTEPKMSSTDTSPKINLPTIQVESDLSRSSNQRDSDIKEKTEFVDSQASSENSQDATLAEQTPDKQTCAEMLQEDKIMESSTNLVEGIDAECKTSAIAENQAGIGQLNEGEGLASVSHFSENSDSAVDLKRITHQLDPTDDISDVEEGEMAISLLASDTDMEQNLKCDSEPDQANEDIKYASLQKCETIAETPSGMRNDKIADEK